MLGRALLVGPDHLASTWHERKLALRQLTKRARSAALAALMALSQRHCTCHSRGGLRSSTDKFCPSVRQRQEQACPRALHASNDGQRGVHKLGAAGRAALFTGACISAAGASLMLAPATAFGLLFKQACVFFLSAALWPMLSTAPQSYGKAYPSLHFCRAELCAVNRLLP